jgi:hypothetical protein
LKFDIESNVDGYILDNCGDPRGYDGKIFLLEVRIGKKMESILDGEKGSKKTSSA